jgi:monomeric isocitrate dehydrogenase
MLKNFFTSIRYYAPDDNKANNAMRPSKLFNKLIE